jgi:hypothetical protein
MAMAVTKALCELGIPPELTRMEKRRRLSLNNAIISFMNWATNHAMTATQRVWLLSAPAIGKVSSPVVMVGS